MPDSRCDAIGAPTWTTPHNKIARHGDLMIALNNCTAARFKLH